MHNRCPVLVFTVGRIDEVCYGHGQDAKDGKADLLVKASPPTSPSKAPGTTEIKTETLLPFGIVEQHRHHVGYACLLVFMLGRE